MIKIVTYNVFQGGEERLPAIFQVLETISADVIGIQEACKWDEQGIERELLKRFDIPPTQYVYAKASPRSVSGRVYDLGLFSKLPILESKVIRNVKYIWHAAIAAVIDIGNRTPVVFIVIHLSPKSPEWRLKEIAYLKKTILDQYKDLPVVMMGDFNSLAAYDPYTNLDEQLQWAKITKFSNPAVFDEISKIQTFGFRESCPFSPSVFATSDDRDHLDLRLDYLFIKNLPDNFQTGWHIVKTPQSLAASDHLPVVLEISHRVY